MTRFSASRGIIYSAPPGPDGSRTDAADPAGATDGAAEEEPESTDGDADPAVTDATADD